MKAEFTPVDQPGLNTREHFVRLWEHLEQQYKVLITVHDHIGCLLLSDGDMLRPRGNLHRSNYCDFCRRNYHQQCRSHCSLAAMRQASTLGKPFISSCYAGVVELVMPLFLEGEHAATIFAGSFRIGDKEPPAHWSSRQKNLYSALPLWHRSNVPNLLRALELFGAAALNFAGNERLNPPGEPSRASQIEAFFQRSLSMPDCSLSDLAKKLHLSNSRTSHILQEEFHKSFNELLNEARIRRICKLLRSTQLPLRQIAVLTGFGNQYYLSRVFRSKMGIPPGEYRKNETPPAL